MKEKTPPRLRAEKGSVERRILLRLPEEVGSAVEKAAKKAKTSIAEWIRTAIRKAL